MGFMHKAKVEKDYVEIPNITARAPESMELSLQALGLLVNMWSYPVDKWVLHKTELYKRFTKNKETSVRSAFKELVSNNFMIEVKYRKNGRNEYDYIYRSYPFTEEEKAEYMAKLQEEYGEISTLDFQDLKNKTSKSGPQNQEIINTIQKKNGLKKDNTKEKKKDLNPFDSEYNPNSNMPNIIDDEKDQEFRVNIFAFKEFVKEFQEQYSNVFDNEMYNAIYQQMHTQRLRIITTKEAVTQARYMQRRQDEGKLQVGDYAAYFVGGIKKKRTSEHSALLQRKIDKMIKEQKAKNEREYRERIARGFRGETMYEGRSVPFYNWLES